MSATREAPDSASDMKWVELMDDHSQVMEAWLADLLPLTDEERHARIAKVWATLSANGRDMLRATLIETKKKVATGARS